MEAISNAVGGSPATRVPRTVRDLVEHLARPDMFHCMQGQPYAYMEFLFGNILHRGVYQTVKFAMHAPQADAERELVLAVLDVFERARAEFRLILSENQPLLFWRRMPCIEEYKIGGACLGVDANGSPVYNEHPLTVIHCRAWIPGVSLAGVPHDDPAPLIGVTP